MAGLLKWAKSAVKRAPSPPRQYSNVNCLLSTHQKRLKRKISELAILPSADWGCSFLAVSNRRKAGVWKFVNGVACTGFTTQIRLHSSSYRRYAILAAFEGGRDCSTLTAQESSGSRDIYLPDSRYARVHWGASALRLGNAVYGTKLNDDDAYPDVYRCPEVMLHLPWSYSADIWNVGAMIWDIFEGKHLFSGQEPKRGCYTTRAHLTELISVLGPPPLELIKRGERSAEWFDGNGQWLKPDENEPERLPLFPSSSLEAAEENLKGKDNELFLSFIKSMLQWEREKRKTARDFKRSLAD